MAAEGISKLTIRYRKSAEVQARHVIQFSQEEMFQNRLNEIGLSALYGEEIISNLGFSESDGFGFVDNQEASEVSSDIQSKLRKKTKI